MSHRIVGEGLESVVAFVPKSSPENVRAMFDLFKQHFLDSCETQGKRPHVQFNVYEQVVPHSRKKRVVYFLVKPMNGTTCSDYHSMFSINPMKGYDVQLWKL